MLIIKLLYFINIHFLVNLFQKNQKKHSEFSQQSVIIITL